MIYILHRENRYTFKMQNNILKTVAKACEKVLRLNMTKTLCYKGENRNFSFTVDLKSHITRRGIFSTLKIFKYETVLGDFSPFGDSCNITHLSQKDL